MGKFCNIFTRFFGRIHAMFTKDIGIDLGTANTLVYMKGRGIIMREPSVVAVDPRSDELRVRSVGHEAKAVIGRAPGSIVAVRPLKDGVIADFRHHRSHAAKLHPPGLRQQHFCPSPGGHLRAVRRHRGRAPRRAPGSSQGGRTPGHSH